MLQKLTIKQKNYPMKNLLFAFLGAVTLLAFACNQNATNTGDAGIPGKTDNFVFYESSSKAAEVAKNPSSEVSDPFEINKVWVEDEAGKKWVHVEVTQKLGCKQSYREKYEVIWSGVMIMIYPPQVSFYLKYNSDGCSELKENVADTIILDLYEIFEDEKFVDDAKFTVINASKSSPGNDYEAERKRENR